MAFIGQPNFINGEPQREYLFDVVFSRSKDEAAKYTSAAAQDFVSTILAAGNLDYISDKVVSLHPPQTSLVYKDINVGMFAKVPVVAGLETPDFAVKFIEDEYGFVYGFWSHYIRLLSGGTASAQHLGTLPIGALWIRAEIYRKSISVDDDGSSELSKWNGGGSPLAGVTNLVSSITGAGDTADLIPDGRNTLNRQLVYVVPVSVVASELDHTKEDFQYVTVTFKRILNVAQVLTIPSGEKKQGSKTPTAPQKAKTTVTVPVSTVDTAELPLGTLENVANMKPGQRVRHTDGTTSVLTANGIAYARKQLGIEGNFFD